MKQTIQTLVVEDEVGIRFFLKEILQQMGHTVEFATNGQEALEWLRESRFDLVMLDLRLGGRIDGMRILRAAKWRWPDIVAIILTGNASLDSTLQAIRENVDGYLLKPATPDELREVINEALARRESASQKAEKESPRILEWEGLSVDLHKHEATLNGEPLHMPGSEFALLAHLMKNAPRVIPGSELVRVAQGYEVKNEREARDMIKYHIHRLRKKIDTDPTKPSHIRSVRSVGYAFGSQE